MSFARALATVGGLTLVSRIAGFGRDILMAAMLGAGPIADAFFVALKLPNLFRRLTAEGAFSVSFVPLFSESLTRDGRAVALRFAEDALAVMLTVLAPFTLVAVLAMPALVSVIAPGFVDDPVRYAAAVDFARITFPYLMLMSLTALMGGVLNALDRFAPFAAAPILFNVCLIVSLVALTPFTPDAGWALSYGVAAAGIVQLVWLAWSLRRAGVTLAVPVPRLSPRIKQLFRLMGPGAIGAGVMQINLFIDVLIASLLPAGAISYLYYADRLNQLPLGVIGIAIGTALLPLLSRHLTAAQDGGAEARSALAADGLASTASTHSKAAALATQNRALEFGLLLAVPCAAGLIALSEPIIAVLFERGAFDASTTRAVAAALIAYAIGIPGYIIVKVLSTAFHARQDTVTPVRIAILCTVLNTLVSLGLSQLIGHVGIALSTGLAAWLNAGLLYRALARTGDVALERQTARRIGGAFAAAGAMAAVLTGATSAGWLASAGAVDPVTGPLTVAVAVAVGAGLYVLAAIPLTGLRRSDIRAAFSRQGDAR